VLEDLATRAVAAIANEVTEHLNSWLDTVSRVNVLLSWDVYRLKGFQIQGALPD